mmetsp:Transcript_167091/g.536606  ORF Transcript_167091/g.536606 Transcript_167091/m.536606 type:complete len:97 (-) Transcript_167091:230-520(-)
MHMAMARVATPTYMMKANDDHSETSESTASGSFSEAPNTPETIKFAEWGATGSQQRSLPGLLPVLGFDRGFLAAPLGRPRGPHDRRWDVVAAGQGV